MQHLVFYHILVLCYVTSRDSLALFEHSWFWTSLSEFQRYLFTTLLWDLVWIHLSTVIAGAGQNKIALTPSFSIIFQGGWLWIQNARLHGSKEEAITELTQISFDSHLTMSSNLLTPARIAAVRRLQTGANSERSICSVAVVNKDRTSFSPPLKVHPRLQGARSTGWKRSLTTGSRSNDIMSSMGVTNSDHSWNLKTLACASLLGAAWISHQEQQNRRIQSGKRCDCEPVRESCPVEKTADQTPLLATMAYSDPRSGILYPHATAGSQLDASKTTTVRAGVQSSSKATQPYRQYDVSRTAKWIVNNFTMDQLLCIKFFEW